MVNKDLSLVFQLNFSLLLPVCLFACMLPLQMKKLWLHHVTLWDAVTPFSWFHMQFHTSCTHRKHQICQHSGEDITQPKCYSDGCNVLNPAKVNLTTVLLPLTKFALPDLISLTLWKTQRWSCSGIDSFLSAETLVNVGRILQRSLKMRLE